MLTPQDLQEVFFEKARFGGYVMKSVDDFLEPLIDDYIALYKENAVLKSKMRLLVERLEAYRGNEAQMKRSMEEAEQECSRMRAEAERQCAAMLATAEADAKNVSADLDNAVAGEQERLNRAKAATQAFVDQVRASIEKQEQALDAIMALDLTQAPVARTAAAPEQKPEQKKAYDFESEADEPKRKLEQQPAPELPSEEDIVAGIERNVEKLTQDVPTPAEELEKTKIMPAIDPQREAKFANLKFGKNYDPTK